MIKKIIGSILLIGFIGVLVWGGVNRTQAKTSEVSQGRGQGELSNLDHENAAADTHGQESLVGDSAHNLEHESQATGVAAQTGATAASHEPRGSGAGQGGDAVAAGQGNGYRGGRNGGEAGQGGGNLQPLDQAEIEALHTALDFEYQAFATYQGVIDSLGEISLFVEIAHSEQNHIAALVNQFEKHGIPVPENTWLGRVPTYASQEQACQAGAALEIADGDLYDQLLAMTDNPALIQVFTHLRQASLESHLPAFEACH